MSPSKSADYTWVAALPDHAIEQIRDAQHDMLGSALRRALDDERWRRRATPLATWPTRELRPYENGDVVIAATAVCEQLWLYHRSLGGTYEYKGPAGAPGCHRPRRQLGDDIECACGWRGFPYGALRAGRAGSGGWWWPTVERAGERCYEVCPYAIRGVDAVDHAPSRWSNPAERAKLSRWDARLDCICGWRSFDGELEPKYLPVQ